MSEVYMDIDLVELAENASDKFAIYDYVITMRKRNRITNAEFMAFYDYMITVMEGLTSKRDVALSMSYGAYTDGILTRQNFVRSFDAMKVAWNDTGSDFTNYLYQVLDYYYNNDLTATEMKKWWKLGDSRNIPLSAMAATGVGETHAAQTVGAKILDYEHDILGNVINSKTKSCMTLGFRLTEKGVYGSPLGGWNASARRTWCNDVVLPALPLWILSKIKYAKRQNGSGGDPSSYGGSGDAYDVLVDTLDKVYIPNVTEFTGGHPVPYRGATDANNSTQYSLCTNASFFSNLGNILTCSACKEYRTSDYNYHRHILYAVNTSGGAFVNDMNTAQYIYLVINI